MLEDPTHVRFFTADSLTRVARDAGFAAVRVDRLVVDSLSVDVASAARALRPPGPAGALSSPFVRAGAIASAPIVVRPAGDGAPDPSHPSPHGSSRAPVTQQRGLRRSARLFRSFLVEQTDPDRFYGELAADSVETLADIDDLAGKVVLDVGAGPRQFAQAFRGRGATYVALDHDRTVSSVADGGVAGSAVALPFADGSVDIVFSSNLLEHVPDFSLVADEMVRVTRPGGLLYLSYTNWMSPWGAHEASPWHWLGADYALRHYVRKPRPPTEEPGGRDHVQGQRQARSGLGSPAAGCRGPRGPPALPS